MTAPLNIDQWLTALYDADRKNKLEAKLNELRAAIADDMFGLGVAGREKLAELKDMIAARGEQACAFSTKYRNYLVEAFK